MKTQSPGKKNNTATILTTTDKNLDCSGTGESYQSQQVIQVLCNPLLIELGIQKLAPARLGAPCYKSAWPKSLNNGCCSNISVPNSHCYPSPSRPGPWRRRPG